MKPVLFFAILFFYFTLGITESISAFGSNFSVGFYEHVHGAQSITLYIHTRKPSPVSFSITTLDGGFTYTGTTTSNSPGVVAVPSTYEVYDSTYSWRRKGLKISTSATESVSVVAWSYRSAADYMSYLALPCHSQLTSEYVYYVVSTRGWSDQPSQFLIVGCSDNSNVTIVPSNSITVPSDPQLSGASNTIVTAGQSYNFALHSLQTLFVFEPYVDLTGTRISSDRPLTIISGHEASRVPFGYSDADPIVTQLTPTATWGKTFLLAPHAGRLNGQGYKVIAAYANTTAVRTCGLSSVSLVFDGNNTSWFETGSNIYCSLIASQPIYVAKIGLSRAYNGSNGDPCTNTIPPVEQYETDSIEFTTFSQVSDSYYSVVVPNDDHFNGSLLIDGAVVTISNWTSIYNSGGHVIGYGYTAPSSGTTSIRHSFAGGQLFVSVFGWTGSGGYCYAGGMKLNPLSSISEAEVSFNSTQYTVNEGDGAVIVYLQRLVNLTGNATVIVFVDPSPMDIASVGEDYSNVSIVINFSSGQTFASASIPILDDSLPENVETFTVSIEAVSGSIAFPIAEAVVNIVDNDMSGNFSAFGSDFSVGFYEHVHGAQSITLYIHTRKPSPVSFSITTLDGGFTYTGTTTSNSPGVVAVPSTYEVYDRTYSWRRKGLRISTSATESVSVVAWSYRSAADYMSYLALPCHSQLTSEYVYFVVSTRGGMSNQPSQFLIVGCSDNSNVTIVPSNNITVPSDPQLSGASNTIVTAGQSYNFALHSLQTLFVFEVNVDLTGTRISSDKPLTIISGHEASKVPFGYSDADPIVTQLTPTVTWGKTFLLAPHAGRLNGQGYKVIAAYANTTAVRTCGLSSVSLVFDANNTSWFETGSNIYCSLVASQPIYVAKIGLSHAYNGSYGDPCTNTIPPIEQYETESIEFTPFPEVSDSYYSVVVPSDNRFNGSLLIDDSVITISNWTSIYNSGGHVIGYGYTAPSSGTTSIGHIFAGGQLFVSVFGWTTYGGYCYAGGMKLNPLSSMSEAEISFNSTQYTVNEGDGAVIVYLQRLVNLTGNATVIVFVDPSPTDTALVGEDYSNVSIVINFSSGQTFAIASIPILDDSLLENVETFTVSIEAVSGSIAFPIAEAVVNIVDNDVSGNFSAFGSDFSVGFYEHVHGAQSITLYIHTRKPSPVSFSITTLDGGFTYTGTTTSNSPGVVAVPSTYEVYDRTYSWRRKGLKISTSATESVSVVAWSYRNSADYMSYLALPCHAQLTSEYVYYVVSTLGYSNHPSQFLIVGCSDNSNVTIVPSNNITVPSDPQLSGASNIMITAGQSYNFFLHSLQTLFVFEPYVDLTGTRISSDRPLTIISGHEASKVPFGYSDADPIVTQLTPTATWGKTFLLAPHAGRLNGQGYKVIAAYANTTAVRTCGLSSVSLVFDANNTSWFETGSNIYCSLVASQPIYVAKIGLSYAYNGSYGDPCTNTIPPIEQYETESIEFTPFPEVSDSYYSVVVPNDDYFNGSLLIDDAVITISNWTSIYNSGGHVIGYGYTAPSSGTTSIRHSFAGGQLFVSVFGWTTYGGYCYAGGMKLNPLSSISEAEVSFNSTQYTVNEGDGAVIVYLQRLVNLTGNATVIVFVDPSPTDTASVGEDYSNVSIVINFSSGQTFASAAIPILDDSLLENVETFTVSIEAVSGAIAFPIAEAVVNIVDNDMSGNFSAFGSDFSVGFYEHVHGAQSITLYIHTRKPSPVSFSITTLDGGFTYTGTTTSNNPGVIAVPSTYEVYDRTYSWRRKGLKISTSATESVSVVAWSYRNSADFMSYLALPCHSQLTSEYVYYVVSTTGWSNQPSQFLIVGCSDNSNVTIVPSNNITVPSDPQLSGASNIMITAGQSYNFVLHSLQTLFVFEPYVDLTGTRISSDRPLTIISGHEASRVPFGYSDADPIVTQLTPTATWGKTFLLAPHAGRLNGQGYKVIAAYANTTAVRTCGLSSVSLVFDANNTSWFETGSNIYCSLVASQPIYVAKIGLSRAYNGSNGDPCTNTIPPVEQYETDSIEFTTFSQVADSYYSVVIPNDDHFNGSLLIDDAVITISNWTSIYNSGGHVIGYGYTAPSSGTTSIGHSFAGGQLFVSVFGWTPNGGYCYAGGMKLNPLSSISEAEISFNSTQYTVNEGDGAVIVYLQRLVNLTTNATVIVFVDPSPTDTALVGEDYSNVSIVINFSSGQTFASASIPILDDSLLENVETFTVSIEAVSGSIAFPIAEAVVNIVDNDMSGNFSAFGSDFSVGFYEHVHGAQSITLYIHTRKPSPVSFSITTLDGGFTYTGTTTSNSPGVVAVPSTYEVYDRTYSWRRKGLKISTSATESVSVVAWSYRNSADFMSYLALPCHSQLTSEYVYYVVSTKGWSDQPSQFLIVSCSDNSNVTIVPSNNITVPSDPQLSGASNIMITAGQSYNFVLHSLQTLFVFEPYVDLTGTRIFSDRPLTILSGHEASRVPFGHDDADPIVTQLTPTATWGKTFLLAPHAGRLNGQGYKVIAAYANTTAVRTCGLSSVSLVFDANNTSWFETGSNIYCSLVASQPIYVAKLGLSQAYNGSNGDPCANTIPPVEQYETESIEFTTFSEVANSYYSVVVPNDSSFNGSLLINNTIVTLSNWTSIYNIAGHVIGYGYTATSSGTTSIRHSFAGGQLFVSVFGWTTYGGYCYAGGMKLNPLSSISEAEVSFNSTQYTVNEGDGAVIIYLQRLVNLTGNATVIVFVDPSPTDTALVGEDYSNVSIVINFSNGQMFASASIPILDDSLRENTENFTISIEALSGATAFPIVMATVSIVDNDGFCSFDNGGCEHYCFETLNSSYCECSNGYSLQADNHNCSLNPSCLINNGGCEQICTQLAESVNCSCYSGYTVMNSSHCADIDECSVNNGGCSQSCVNSLGGFSCACFPGYSFDLDLQTCIDNNECAINNGGCDQICHNTNGSYFCSCNFSYVISADNHHCNDINECTTGHNECNHICVNTNGSYSCGCYAGYHLLSNQKTCADANECVLNNGNCSQLCINTIGSYQCSCYSGYMLSITDNYTCTDIDECTTGNNYCEHNCYNTEGSYICDCQAGFELSNNLTCSDIDECLNNNGGCDQICVNQVGSHYCQCNASYTLDEDGQGCSEAINDCSANPNVCEHLCHTSNNSFYCTCFSGYQLSSNGRTCDEIDECSEELSRCNQLCTNTIGSYNCSCLNGFELLSDKYTCQDINECLENNGGCEDVCTNTIGSYLCSCQASGYSLSSDKHNCSDINECNLSNGGCNQNCINTAGSYYCTCASGYLLNSNGHTCRDVDECINSNCEHLCTNMNGSYICSCTDGYSLDANGRNCSDINECSVDNGGCEQVCTNEEPFYSCSCYSGFRLYNDRFCSDIHECVEEISGCSQVCINTIGSYTCNCQTGFLLSSDNHTCIDIDECLVDNGGCEQICENTNGSRNCLCNNGYAKNGNNCTDIDECNFENNGCSQLCTNSLGSYSCGCLTGFALSSDMFNCTDINECESDNGGCSHLCVNTFGSYQCQCYNGYQSDDNNCIEINECLADNGGCEQVCTNTNGSFQCSCYSGYFGSVFCSDINECGLNTSGCNQTCINTVGSYYCDCETGYYLSNDNHTCIDVDECSTGIAYCDQVCTNDHGSFHCGCNSGFTLSSNGIVCKDINECMTNDSNCEQTCLNTIGSYYCQCVSGFRLNTTTNATCYDIDECNEGISGCDDICINSVGSYSCSCHNGYKLNPDNHTCIDSDECTDNNGGCAHICQNTNGSYACSCLAGFILNDHDCVDINECSANSGCAHFCNNTIGSYVCSCNTGYYLDIDGHNCSDINECTDNNGGCYHSCINTVGSYQCQCYDGYQLDNNSANCIDIDECSISNGGCQQECKNMNGSFVCSCYPGYVGSVSCTDINECITNDNNCEQTCLNTIGSYYCQCDSGFKLNATTNATCYDINECEEDISGCDDMCINSIGSYSCSCHNGYKLNTDNHTCIDIDECTDNNGGCAHICRNTDGSYVCSCRVGYSLTSNNQSCADNNECEFENGGCNQTCSNTDGSFTCSCLSGYTLENDVQCIDFNECLHNEMYKCSQNCVNTQGSYSCVCLPGYYLGSDNHTCFDIDECSQANGGCDQICINRDGSFRCTCRDGYVLNNDTRTFTCKMQGLATISNGNNHLNLESDQASAYIGIPVAIVVTAVVIIIIATALFILILKSKKKAQEYSVSNLEDHEPRFNPLYFSSEKEDLTMDKEAIENDIYETCT